MLGPQGAVENVGGCGVFLVGLGVRLGQGGWQARVHSLLGRAAECTEQMYFVGLKGSI